MKTPLSDRIDTIISQAEALADDAADAQMFAISDKLRVASSRLAIDREIYEAAGHALNESRRRCAAAGGGFVDDVHVNALVKELGARSVCIARARQLREDVVGARRELIAAILDGSAASAWTRRRLDSARRGRSGPSTMEGEPIA